MRQNKGHLILVAILSTLLSASISVAAAPVQLSIWHHWTAHRSDYVQSMLDAFMAEHPDIKVEQMVVGTGGAQDRLATYIVSGAAPELVMVSSGYSFPFMVQGGFYPLDEFAARDGVDLDRFISADLAGFQLLGETYAMPVTSGAAWTNIMLYNKDLMSQAGLPDEAPADWEAWTEATRRITKRNEDGQPEIIGSHMPSLMQAGAWAGAVPWSDDWRQARMDTPRMHETAEHLLHLADSNYGSYRNYTAFMATSAITRFQNQDVGMWFINNSGFGFADTFNFEWGAALAPVNTKYDDAAPIGYASGTWAYAIPITVPPEKLEAAWTLLKWLTTTEEAGGWFTRIQGRPSPITEFNSHPDYRAANPYWDVVISAVGYDQSPPPGVGEVIGTAHTQIMNRTVQPFQGIADAQRAVQQALDLYWSEIER